LTFDLKSFKSGSYLLPAESTSHTQITFVENGQILESLLMTYLDLFICSRFIQRLIN